MNIQKRVCQTCGKVVSGRTDKKFCDDACRSVFNNRNRRNGLESVRNTDAILRRNRMILRNMLNEQEAVRLEKNRLLATGYRPEFLTSIASDPAGGIIRYCYEFGVRRISGNEVQIFSSKTG